MICKNCGFDIPDGYKFCPNCGDDQRDLGNQGSVYYQAPMTQVQPQMMNQVPPMDQGYVQQTQPTYNYGPGAPTPGKVLGLGITALALSTVPIAGIAGLIIAIICISKAGMLKINGVILSKQARIGRGLAIAAIPCSIIFSIIWVAYFFMIYEMIDRATPGLNYYYYR